MEEWILVDNRALLRVDDISAITIDEDDATWNQTGYKVNYRNCDGVSLHSTRHEDLAEAQHAIAEFMLNFSEPESNSNHELDEVTKYLRQNQQWTMQPYVPSVTTPQITYDPPGTAIRF